MKASILLIVAAFASTPAVAQHYPPEMQPVADYSRCVQERARAVVPKFATIDEAIDAAFAKCKGARSKAVAAVRARSVALGIPATTAKQTAETMIASSDTSLRDGLRQDLATKK
ncbi:hypothetical protein [Sphingopyxis sp.]|uniref:hypothetical protein n=1 Tax=Sphingopyxis sp. TaxID=1908224 RepID=UPI003D10B6EA